MCIKKKNWDVLDNANLVGKLFCQGKNDYETRGIFYGLFLAPKMKNCLTIDEFGIIQQHMTFKGFNYFKRLLDRSQYFDMLEGKKISAVLARSWEKSSNNGIIIPVKMRRCNECNGEILCKECNNQINESKDFEANLHLLKLQPPNQFVICFLIINHILFQLHPSNTQYYLILRILI